MTRTRVQTDVESVGLGILILCDAAAMIRIGCIAQPDGSDSIWEPSSQEAGQFGTGSIRKLETTWTTSSGD